MSWSVQIRSLEPLKHVQSKKLEELYVCENKVDTIENISHLTSLSILELGSNRIKVCIPHCTYLSTQCASL